MSNDTKSVLIKMSNKERDIFGKLADDKELTLKDLVLTNTVYSNKDTEIKRLEKELHNLTQKDKHNFGQMFYESSREDSYGREQANIRLDDYSRQLEQAQLLQLDAKASNKTLKLELEDAKEAKDDSKGFFARLFNR